MNADPGLKTGDEFYTVNKNSFSIHFFKITSNANQNTSPESQTKSMFFLILSKEFFQ